MSNYVPTAQGPDTLLTLPNELLISILWQLFSLSQKQQSSSHNERRFIADITPALKELAEIRLVHSRLRALVDEHLWVHVLARTSPVRLSLMSLEYKALRRPSSEDTRNSNVVEPSIVPAIRNLAASLPEQQEPANDSLTLMPSPSTTSTETGRQSSGLDEITLTCYDRHCSESAFQFRPLGVDKITFPRLQTSESLRELRISLDAWLVDPLRPEQVSDSHRYILEHIRKPGESAFIIREYFLIKIILSFVSY
jgi:hypothetical protein